MKVPSRLFLKRCETGSWSGGKTFEPGAVHQKNIQPAVVVVVIERDPAARGLKQVFVFVLAAEDGLGVEAGGTSHVDERHPKTGFIGLWSGHGQDISERQNQGCPGERPKKFTP